jgi:hypothetical protein
VLCLRGIYALAIDASTLMKRKINEAYIISRFELEVISLMISEIVRWSWGELTIIIGLCRLSRNTDTHLEL